MLHPAAGRTIAQCISPRSADQDPSSDEFVRLRPAARAVRAVAPRTEGAGIVRATPGEAAGPVSHIISKGAQIGRNRTAPESGGFRGVGLVNVVVSRGCVIGWPKGMRLARPKGDRYATLQNTIPITDDEVKPMTRLPILRKGLVLFAAIAFAACGDGVSPLAPSEDAPDQAAALAPAANVMVLCRAVAAKGGDVAVSGWITPEEGGRLAAGGVVFQVPPGAVRKPVRVTMMVPADSHLVVRFAPHGLRFSKPARLSVDLAGAAGLAALSRERPLVGIYFKGSIQNGRVLPLEWIPVTVEGSVASMPIRHFSAYTMAEG